MNLPPGSIDHTSHFPQYCYSRTLDWGPWLGSSRSVHGGFARPAVPTQSCELAAKIVEGLLLPADFALAPCISDHGRTGPGLRGCHKDVLINRVIHHRCQANSWRERQLPVLSARATAAIQNRLSHPSGNSPAPH